jgi:hypothetical protein
VALRLLDGDERITEALRKGELGNLSRGANPEGTEHPSKLQLEASR